MLSKRHYEMLARVIHDRRAGPDGQGVGPLYDLALRDVTADLCDELARDNPRFSRTRFIHAASGGDLDWLEQC